MRVRPCHLVLFLLSSAGGPARGQAAPGPATVVAGAWHSCLLTATGQAHCWGSNFAGQLGRESAETCKVAKKVTSPCGPVPLPVESALRFTRLVAGEGHTCGLTLTGEAWCWGNNYVGQLGSDSAGGNCVDPANKDLVLPCSAAPLQVQGKLLFSALTAGAYHTCGLTVNGAVYCWGGNNRGQLGRATPQSYCAKNQRCSRMPLRVPAESLTALAAGGDRTCGLKPEGTVLCWGSWGHATRTPVLVRDRKRFSLLAVGLNWGLGVTAKGTAYWWSTPFPDDGEDDVSEVKGPRSGFRITMLGVGAHHICALNDDGIVYCWGDHSRGQLGVGDKKFPNWGEAIELLGDILGAEDDPDLEATPDTWTNKPQRVSAPVQFAGIAAGYSHTCGLAAAGEVFCWGANSQGQLGSGDRKRAMTPQETQPIALEN